MRIHICAVGRLRTGPQRTLIDDYLTRFDRLGRNLGFDRAEIIEIDSKTGSSVVEAKLLSKACPQQALICTLDERGRTMTSPDFAALLANWRDDGQNDVAFIIGGADGLDATLRAQADFSLSFGAMVWPHMLVRVMLAEQLYRAAGILAGTPYHRT